MSDRYLWEEIKDRLSPKAKAKPHQFDIHGGGLDLIFPQIKQWIAADPVRENGSQALVRSAGAVAQGQGARTLPVTSTPAPATVTPPTARDRLPILQRRTGTHER